MKGTKVQPGIRACWISGSGCASQLFAVSRIMFEGPSFKKAISKQHKEVWHFAHTSLQVQTFSWRNKRKRYFQVKGGFHFQTFNLSLRAVYQTSPRSLWSLWSTKGSKQTLMCEIDGVLDKVRFQPKNDYLAFRVIFFP